MSAPAFIFPLVSRYGYVTARGVFARHLMGQECPPALLRLCASHLIGLWAGSDSPRGPACGDTGGASATPDGNHGDNDFGVTK